MKETPSRQASSRCSATVGEDAEEPGVEALAFLITMQRAMDPDERVLHALFGVLTARQKVLRKPQAARIVRANELGEGDRIAVPGVEQSLSGEDGRHIDRLRGGGRAVARNGA